MSKSKKSSTILKIDKSTVATLKDQMEANQVGATLPSTDADDNITITVDGHSPVTTSSKKLAQLAAKVKAAGKPPRRLLKEKSSQGDMVTDGKMIVPEPTSPLYIAGKRLKEACIQEKLNDDEKAEAMLEVMQAMRRAKRYIYKVEGYAFELHHQGAQDKVRVIKPK